jgi:hypothetical protein
VQVPNWLSRGSNPEPFSYWADALSTNLIRLLLLLLLLMMMMMEKNTTKTNKNDICSKRNTHAPTP